MEGIPLHWANLTMFRELQMPDPLGPLNHVQSFANPITGQCSYYCDFQLTNSHVSRGARGLARLPSIIAHLFSYLNDYDFLNCFIIVVVVRYRRFD